MGAGPSRKVELQDGPGGLSVTEDVLNRLVDADSNLQDPEGNRINFRDANKVRRAMMLLHQEREQMQDTIEDAHRQGLEQGAEEMRRRKDREIRQMDIVWQDRLDAINREREDTVSDEFNSKVHELSARFRLKQSPVVCQEAQNSVLQCYQSNKTTSLNCNEQVRAFVQCVETARFNYLSSTATGTATGTKRA